MSKLALHGVGMRAIVSVMTKYITKPLTNHLFSQYFSSPSLALGDKLLRPDEANSKGVV
jgi:hypothetical protein